MRICLIGKYPPIQGGVAVHNYWIARWLAERQHEVHVVTNAQEVEDGFRVYMTPADSEWYEFHSGAGFVKVWNTERANWKYRHIPQANPFTTKLASLASEVVEEHSAEAIVAYYYEPYVVAGYLAATWTGKPFIVRHAGSDVGRLLKIPQLGRCYTHILKRADRVCTGPSTRDLFLSLNVSEDRLYPDPGFVLPRRHFNPEVAPLDVNELLRQITTSDPEFAAKTLRWNTDPIDTSLPTVGVYGKIGPFKGHFELVAALGGLKQSGLEFNFLALCHGLPDDEEKFRAAIIEAGIESQTRILPFLPHWRIPAFLRSLTAVCFLEHNFPIKFHNPGVPQEALACGAPLVLSAEIARKQPFSPRLIHGENVMIVRDPRDRQELQAALRALVHDPARARVIGLRGERLMQAVEGFEVCAGRYEAMVAGVLSPSYGSTPASPVAEDARACNIWDGVAWRWFPHSRKVLGGSAASVISELASGLEPESLPNIEDKVVRLCEAFAGALESSPDVPGYAPDLLRWELLQLPIKDSQVSECVDSMFFRGEGGEAGQRQTPDPSLVPALAANVMIRDFGRDMIGLSAALAKGGGAVPADWPEDPSFYLFQCLPMRSKNRVLQISAMHYFLLSSCDGAHSIGEIAAALAASHAELFQTQDALAACHSAVAGLFDEGLITLTRREREPEEAEALT